MTWKETDVGSGRSPVPVDPSDPKDRPVLCDLLPRIALERTMFFDHIPSDRHREVWRALVDVHRRGMELIRPGAKCSEIARELNQMLFDRGLLKYRTFGYGHSFGDGL